MAISSMVNWHALLDTPNFICIKLVRLRDRVTTDTRVPTLNCFYGEKKQVENGNQAESVNCDTKLLLQPDKTGEEKEFPF